MKSHLGILMFFKLTIHNVRQTLWFMPLMPALGELKQENCYKFETSLGCVVSFRPATASV